jgi:hypothetical protein
MSDSTTDIVGISSIELTDDRLTVSLVLADGSVGTVYWPVDDALRKCLSVDGDAPLVPSERDRAVKAKFGAASRWELLGEVERLQAACSWRLRIAQRKLRASAPVERGLAAASAAPSSGKGVTASDLEALVTALAQDTGSVLTEKLAPMRETVESLQRRAERHADHLASIETRVKKLTRHGD